MSGEEAHGGVEVQPVHAVELADEFGRTAKLLGARMTQRLAGHDLSMPRANILVALFRHGPMRITQLHGHVGISQGTASTLVDALVREGLAERRTDPHDGRATEVAATDAGRRRGQAWLDDYERAAEEVFAPLSAEHRHIFLAALRTLARNHPSTH